MLKTYIYSEVNNASKGFIRRYNYNGSPQHGKLVTVLKLNKDDKVHINAGVDGGIQKKSERKDNFFQGLLLKTIQ